MRVAQGRAGDEELLLVAQPAREARRAQFLEPVASSFRKRGPWRRGREDVDGRAQARPARGGGSPRLRMAVDDDVADIAEDLRRAVAPRRELEQRRRLVHEARRQLPLE